MVMRRGGGPVRWLVAVAGSIALAAAAVACSDGDDPTPATTTTTVAATSSTGGTTTPPSSGSTSSSTTPPGPPPTAPTMPLTIPAGTDGVSPDGSGCSPSSATTLPDGTWFGVASSDGTTVSLDLACFFSGDAANAAALADDPAAEVPVPNDYYIRNQVPTLYALPLADAVATLVLSSPGSTDFQPQADGPAEAAAAIGAATPPVRVWVVVDAGQVTAIQQLFLP